MEEFPSRVGTIINGYELREYIGHGGFGVVYRAFERSLKRNVAMKIIHPKYAYHPTFVQRFEDEARLIAQLEHFHIVPLYHFWRDGSDAYIVMRWLRGGSVRKLLDTSGPLQIEVVARLLDQICEALTFAHKSKIVHRDLKPDNILRDDNGNFCLTDFGIAKDLAIDLHLTPTDMIIGSPPYITPEQIKHQPVTPRTDLYTLGVVLYELLVGEPPFAGASAEQYFYYHLHEPLPSLTLKRPDLPPNLDAVIQKATAKDPEARFESALEIAEVFRQQLTQPALPQAPESGAHGARSVITPMLKGDLKARLYENAAAVLEKPRRLIGREALISQILSLLDEAERVLLHGMGGVGKTSIAATVAAEYIATGKGNVIWLEAGNADENLLFEALARAFDQQQEIARKSTGERIEVIRNLLLEKPSLLVLDNVWKGSALFQFMKAVPHTMPLLMTSRHRMPIDGAVLEIHELDRDNALALLSYHARRDYTDDANALALCDQLGNHPFALEIAGKRIKIQSHMSIAQFMESIADSPHDLSLPMDFADPGREGMRNLLDDSVNELNANVRAVFVTMGGMFVPTATFELLALCLKQSEKEIVEELNDLQQRGLVRLVQQTGSIPTHYRLHDLTYSYARSMFVQENGDRAVVVATVQQLVTQRAEDYDLLEFEQHNILGAARAAQRFDDNHALIDIIKVLAVDGEYFAARGHTETSMELLKAAIDAAKRKEMREVSHRLLGKLGDYYRKFPGDLDNALDAYQEALELAPNANRQAILLAFIGAVRFQQKAPEADNYYKLAEEIARENHDDFALAVVLNHRGFQALKNGNYEVGWQISNETAKLATKTKQHQYLFFALLNRGGCEQYLGQLSQALATHQQAYELARDQNNHLWMAHALRDIGEDYHVLGDRNQAQLHFAESLRLWQQNGAKAEAIDLIRYMKERNYAIQPE